jgi:hypothetical protein
MSGNTTLERREPTTWPRDMQSRALTFKPVDDALLYVRQCIRENPEAAALWCFGIGFVLGWKLKPW